ncbi:MAG: PDZ domain-containing protein [Deltaproteobacteria bacterium]|nr:PDZ domain-containing protein [Deltaproteobacteria bacterium]
MRASLGALALLTMTAFAALQLGCGGPGGIHARMAYSEEGGVRVVDVPPGSPAEKGGLRPDDRIATIEGVSVTSLSYQEVVERLRGRSGTTVEIEVARDGELVPLTIEREPYER